MPVTQMRVQAISQVASEANIVEPIFPIQGIDTMTFANIVTDNVLVNLQRLPRDSFKMLTN